MPRWRSSGALSISSKATAVPPPCSARTFVIAAVSVVLPWSMCPIVPTLRCGFERSNFCLAILSFSLAVLRPDDLGRDRLRHFLVPVELHGERGAPLRHRAQVGRVAEHLRERDARLDRLPGPGRLEVLDAAAAAVQVAHHVPEVVLRRDDLDRHDGLEELRLR